MPTANHNAARVLADGCFADSLGRPTRIGDRVRIGDRPFTIVDCAPMPTSRWVPGPNGNEKRTVMAKPVRKAFWARLDRVEQTERHGEVWHVTADNGAQRCSTLEFIRRAPNARQADRTEVDDLSVEHLRVMRSAARAIPHEIMRRLENEQADAIANGTRPAKPTVGSSRSG